MSGNFVQGKRERQRIVYIYNICKPLSYTITGGAARHGKVKPKTWRISASADATWYLRLKVFTTDQPRCYAFDKVLRPPGFYKKNYGFLVFKTKSL